MNVMVNQQSLNELALFAGAGGGILGGHLLGWKTVCAVEWEQYPASVLCARQNDGLLPPFPIWDDVQSFRGEQWRGIVDVVSGGFPCQDISSAGRGAGIDGERSGMWGEMARIICEVQPRFVFVENSPMLTSRGLGRVLGDLAAMGFDAKWGVLGAADIGAPHKRDRIWIVGKHMGNSNNNGHPAAKVISGVTERSDSDSTWQKQTSQLERSSEQYAELAYTNNNGHNYQKSRKLSESSEQTETRQELNKTSRHHLLADTRCESQRADKGLQPESEISIGQDASIICGEVPHPSSLGQSGQRQHEQPVSSKASSNRQANIFEPISTSDFWTTEPNVGRVVNGLASRVDRLKAIGNGQVPLCAATAWRLLNDF
jgi:DNA (cytosine-5)-methyltransferase 1